MTAMRPSTMPLRAIGAFFATAALAQASQLYERRGGCGEARAADVPRLSAQGLHRRRAANGSRHPGAKGWYTDSSPSRAYDDESCRLSKDQGAGPGGLLSGARRVYGARPRQLQRDERGR